MTGDHIVWQQDFSQSECTTGIWNLNYQLMEDTLLSLKKGKISPP